MASSTDPTSLREDAVNLLKEVPEVIDKFLRILVSIVAFKSTDMGQHFFTGHPYMMIALVLLIVLYFSAWLLHVIAPQLRIGRSFPPFIMCFVLTIGVFISVWALVIIF